MVAPPSKGRVQNHISQGVAVDKIIGRRMLQFSLAMTAIAAMAAIPYFLDRSSEEAVEAQQEPPDRITIIAVAPSNPTGDRIDARVKNVGLAPISTIDKSEIFVITPGVRFDTMTYSAGHEDNTWVEDPVGSSWNPKDTLHIIITLPAHRPLSGEHTLRVSTSKGTIADQSFDVR